MTQRKLVLFLLFCLAIVLSCTLMGRKKYKIDKTVVPDNVKYAGVRSSSYGIRPFPDPQGWGQVMTGMRDHFKGSTPCGIWIVGRMNKGVNCKMEFPADGQPEPHLVFLDVDKHEPYLQHFDSTGIKVFLQVEPANAGVKRLIDLVLDRYKHHPCVIGFGVDVEWYREADYPDWGMKVSDDSARIWEQQVKSYNSDYQLFLKHWDRNWMPPEYRGDLIFISDSQIFESMDAMIREFVEYWADYFKPNPVGFQYGYPSDRPWWRNLQNPPADIGNTIAQYVSQDCGMFWVDFTLREVFPELEYDIMHWE